MRLQHNRQQQHSWPRTFKIASAMSINSDARQIDPRDVVTDLLLSRSGA